jgi:hypothetical protein
MEDDCNGRIDGNKVEFKRGVKVQQAALKRKGML